MKESRRGGEVHAPALSVPPCVRLPLSGSFVPFCLCGVYFLSLWNNGCVSWNEGRESCCFSEVVNQFGGRRGFLSNKDSDLMRYSTGRGPCRGRNKIKAPHLTATLYSVKAQDICRKQVRDSEIYKKEHTLTSLTLP